MTWPEWSRNCITILGVATQADAAMIDSWAGLFERAGYTPAEADEALAWIATHSPPRFRAEYLHALVSRIRQQRQSATARPAQPAEPPPPACHDCSGTGFAIVPDLRARARGRWATTAVLCTCTEGSRLRGNLAERHPPILEDYENTNPTWRDQIEAHRQELLGWSGTVQHAHALDRTLGAILARARQSLPAQSLPALGLHGASRSALPGQDDSPSSKTN